MKKLVIACGVVAMGVFATGCKKDYNCTCTSPNPAGGADIETTAVFEGAKKSDAEDACDKLDAVSADTNCKLEKV